MKTSCWVDKKNQNEWRCSELNSFLFCFGFQLASQHRCTGQTAGMCRDWEKTQHVLPCLFSNEETWKRARGWHRRCRRDGPILFCKVTPYQSCPRRTDSSDCLALHLYAGWSRFLILPTVSTCQFDPSLPAKTKMDKGKPRFHFAESSYRVITFHFPCSQVALSLMRDGITKNLSQ